MSLCWKVKPPPCLPVPLAPQDNPLSPIQWQCPGATEKLSLLKRDPPKNNASNRPRGCHAHVPHYSLTPVSHGPGADIDPAIYMQSPQFLTFLHVPI
jgi:hypothetical protein